MPMDISSLLILGIIVLFDRVLTALGVSWDALARAVQLPIS